MSGDTLFVFAVLVIAAVMMASNRVRFDVVALLVVLALMLSGVLTVGEALAGFGSSVVILVAGLLVVGDMLDRTGVAAAIGDLILKRGGSNETRLLIMVMAAASVLGAVMSSTAVVAIFIPIVLRIGAETKVNPSRLLMPMSYAALISGMLTLIATTPNLVVSEELKNAGYSELGFFSFTPVGLAVLVVAIVYILLVRRLLLRDDGEEDTGSGGQRSVVELWEDFRVERSFASVRIAPGSDLAGRTIAQSELESRFGVRVLGIVRRSGRREERIPSPVPEAEMRTADTLLVVSRPEELDAAVAERGLEPQAASKRDRQLWLYIHGFSNLPEKDIFPRTRTLQRLCDEKRRGEVEVVPLIWPCDADFGIVKDYWDDQEAADASAFSFARLLQRFHKWRKDESDALDRARRDGTLRAGDGPCVKRINVLAHSMGNRVLRGALARWGHYYWSGRVPMLFRNTFMVAADVVNESLERGGAGRFICDCSRNVVVYYASDDLALRASKAANLKNGIASRRLGHSGPEDMRKVPSNVYAVDCDDFNMDYDTMGHSYFLQDDSKPKRSGRLFEDLYRAIRLGRVTDDDPNQRQFVL